MSFLRVRTVRSSLAVFGIVAMCASVFSLPAGSAATKKATTTKKKRSTKPVTTRLASLPAGGKTTYAVTSKTLMLEDTTRPTAATSKSAATKSRKLPTLVLTPTPTSQNMSQKFPLFVFSHGLGGEPVLYEPLLRAIANSGYIVAAPTFPLSSRNAPGGPNFIDQPNQPKDVSFVITNLLKEASVDADKVVVGGHSLGGITTVDLFGNEALRDTRIDAAIVVAGTVNVFSFAKMFTGAATPVLFLHGDLDATVPYDLGYSTYLDVKPPKWFVTVVGGDHSFGMAGDPTKLAATGAVYVDAMVKFADAQLLTGKPAAVTAALQKVVDANATLLKLESAEK